MKRFVSIWIIILLIISVLIPSSADILSASDIYDSSLEALNAYLSNKAGTDISLDDLQAAFQSIGTFERAPGFMMYTAVLCMLQDDDYNQATMDSFLQTLNKDSALNSLIGSEEFATRYPSIRSTAQLSTYVQARQYEKQGYLESAKQQYSQCMYFYDSSIRYMELSSSDENATVPVRDASLDMAAFKRVGNQVTFGAIIQNDSTDSIPITWIVLEADSAHIKLLSLYAIVQLAFSNQPDGSKWDTCSLRAWLNHDFVAAAFSRPEQDALLPMTASELPAGTADRVMLLSTDEFRLYAASVMNKAQCEGHTLDGAAVWWWLRSPGLDSSFAAAVNPIGALNSAGQKAVNASVGVRPVITLDPSRLEILLSRQDELYQSALDLLASGSLQAAQDVFLALGDFEEAPEYALLCEGLLLQAAGKYEDAATRFARLGSWNSADRRTAYCRALDHCISGSYSKAAEGFEELSGWGNASRMAVLCRALASQKTDKQGRRGLPVSFSWSRITSGDIRDELLPFVLTKQTKLTLNAANKGGGGVGTVQVSLYALSMVAGIESSGFSTWNTSKNMTADPMVCQTQTLYTGDKVSIPVTLEAGVYYVHIFAEASCDVKLTVYQKPALSTSSITLAAGKKATLKVLNITADDKAVWSSDNTKVATISKTGVVTAVSTGKATITCKVNSTTLKATIYVPSISKTTVVLLPKGTETLSIKNSAAKAKVTWNSTDASIATVSKGKITAKKAGKTTITCKVDGITLTATVYVPAISATKATLKYGESDTLTIGNAGGKKITWSSSDRSVATVSSKGKIKAVGAGTAKITAKIAGVGKLTCTVTVKPTFSNTSATLKQGKTLQLKVNGPGKQKVTWSSSDTSIAKVSSSGLVSTGNKTGTATITCTVGKTSFKCKVTVWSVASIQDKTTVSNVWFTEYMHSITCKNATGLDIQEINLKINIFIKNVNYYYTGTRTLKPSNGVLTSGDTAANTYSWGYSNISRVKICVASFKLSDGTTITVKNPVWKTFQ